MSYRVLEKAFRYYTIKAAVDYRSGAAGLTYVSICMGRNLTIPSFPGFFPIKGTVVFDCFSGIYYSMVLVKLH